MNNLLEEFLKPFEDATLKTLSEMCQMEILSTEKLLKEKMPEVQSDISGLIGITSKHFRGSMGLHFQASTFLGIMEGMLGETQTEITKDLEDGAAELTNIIFGNAKISLNQMGHKIQMAIPTILRGRKISTFSGSPKHQNLAIQFTTPKGLFWVVFELEVLEAETDPLTSGVSQQLTADVLLEFVRAVKKTLQVQFSANAEVGQPTNKKFLPFTFEVGSVIGVTAKGFEGTFGMFYERNAFLSLINNLLGTEYTDLVDEIQDGASEITNICFGVAKQVLNEKGYSIAMAIPSVIRGEQISSSSPSLKHESIVVPILLNDGKMWIEFNLLPKKES